MSIYKLFSSVLSKETSNYEHELIVHMFRDGPPFRVVTGDQPHQYNQAEFLLDGEPHDLSHLTHLYFLLTTKKELLPPNVPHIYVPYYLQYLVEHHIPLSALSFPLPPAPKTEFCAFMYTNCNEDYPGVRLRNQFFRALKTATALGSCLGSPTIHRSSLPTIEIYRKFKFVIAFENTPVRGYISEKIMLPLLAGSVPIYYGDPEIEASPFNPKRYIHVRDYASWEDCFAYLHYLDTHPAAYDAILNEPILRHPVEASFITGGSIYREIAYKVPQLLPYLPTKNLFSCQTHLVTFADGTRYTHNRIVREAKASGHFNQIHAFDAAHLHLPPTQERGFGYWRWKPQIIRRILEQVAEGDLVVYSDSGNTIRPDTAAMLELYDQALQDSIVSFPIQEIEKVWNKRRVIEAFARRYRGISEWIETPQREANLIIFRNDAKARQMVREWDWWMSWPEYINDEVAPDEAPYFKEHRHDQSIYSLLSKIYNAGINAKRTVIEATRKRH